MAERIWSRGDAAELLRGLAFLVGYVGELGPELRGQVAADLRAIARMVEDEEPPAAAPAGTEDTPPTATPLPALPEVRA